ncbi:MAG: NAD(P)/FAD-dependent oxidoreductase [Thermoguttaceae bacterium]|nr:NAD(P)/FAD-dependent oxidoreductase [Thermoguttaceae bacterium]
MANDDSLYDAVIIGAGMSGLAAGIRLAQYDRRVLILEKHSVIGGLNSFYRRNGRNLDVGLHAMTNFVPKGVRTGPLARILRHLRLSWDDLGLTPQVGSSIAFPGVSLDFSNKFELLESQIAEKFPRQIDGFRKMVANLVDYDQLGGDDGLRTSARAFVSSFITDPLLVEMLFCPIFYYGGARDHDMDFGQFCIMFRAIFLEGFARPYEGIRLLLTRLLKKFKNLGGEIRLGTGVEKIDSDGHRAKKIVLADGKEIYARQFLSSAGWRETMRLCQLRCVGQPLAEGRLSFVETISILDRDPKKLGHKKTLVFFNDSDRFSYEKPDDTVDLRSGVICSPNNFQYNKPLGEGMIRITALANFDRWAGMNEDQYRVEKLRWFDRLLSSAVRFVPDFRGNIIDNDMFTPLTITRYTGHEGGAIYGSADKKYDGQTPLENLFVCGTDQGMLGVVGAIVSGITIVNRYFLSK